MAKKIISATKKGHDGFIPKIYAYANAPTVAPRVDELYKADKWVWFGKRNLWPEQMNDLATNNAILGRCFSLLAVLIAGKGVKFYDKKGDVIEEASNVFDSWMEDTTQEDFLYATAYDIAFLNGKAWVPRRSATNDIVKVDHLDVMRLRSEPLDKDGNVPGYWWSASWQNHRRDDRFAPVSLPKFKVNGTDKRSVMYTKPYAPGQDVYAKPWWTGCVKAAEVWNMIDWYDQSEIDNGFTPTVHLHTYTNKPEDQLREYDKRVQMAYTGTKGRAVFHTYGTPTEGKPEITIVAKGNSAGTLAEIASRCERTIAKAYGMPLPLIGLDFSTGMDGAGAALEQATAQLMKMLVLPKQQLITKDLVKLMNAAGLTDVWEARIEQVELQDDGLDSRSLGAAYLAAVTKDEHRVDVLGMKELGGEEGGKFLNDNAANKPKE